MTKQEGTLLNNFLGPVNRILQGVKPNQVNGSETESFSSFYRISYKVLDIN